MNLIGTYKTKAGRLYQWSFEKFNDGTVRAYIVYAPSYADRAKDSHSTHRKWDNDNYPYICWAPLPTNFDEAMRIAEQWAEHTDNYIQTGETF